MQNQKQKKEKTVKPENKAYGNKINILYIIPQAIQGGAETQLLYLLRGLDQKKFNIYLGLLYDHNEIKDEFNSLSDEGIKLVFFDKKGKYDLTVYVKIAKFLKKNNIQIIHSFMGSHNAYLPALIAKKAIPIGGIMGTQDDDFSKLEKFEEFKIGKKLADNKGLIMVSCSYMGAEVYLKRGFPKDTVYAIPNGIDYRKYSHGKGARVKKEFNLHGKTVLTMVGRLIDTKNQSALIRVFSQLANKYQNTLLMIVGSGPMLETLKKQASDLGLGNRVIFTGNRKDIPDIMAASDIFLFPSLTEGWPNVVGEAMSAGLPAISFEVGDIKDIIHDGVDGFIVGQSEEAMRQKAELLIKNKSLREKMGLAAKKRMFNNFTVEHMVTKYESLYFRLLSELGRK